MTSKSGFNPDNVEQGLLEIREEVNNLPSDGRFSEGSRGHLLITIDNVLSKLGFKPGYENRRKLKGERLSDGP